VGVDIPLGTDLNDHDSTYYGSHGNNEFRTVVWKLEDDRYLSFVWSQNGDDAEKSPVPIIWRGEDGIVLDPAHKIDGEHKQVEFEFEVLKN